MAERWSSIGRTLLRAQAMRINHNLCSNGALGRAILARRYKWLAKLAWPARHLTSLFGYRDWRDLHAPLG
jgi:hypothetical protein